MGKDQMGYYRDRIQFQSNKIAEISLFMEMKYALSNDKTSHGNNQKVLSRCNRCCHVQSIRVSLQIQSKLLLYVISVTVRCFPYRLQELIYTASVITGARLIFSSFHYTFLSCSQIGWGWDLSGESRDVLPSNPQCRAVADSLLWQETSKLSHYGPGLWQPEPPCEKTSRWVVWAEVQLLYRFALQWSVYVCVHSDCNC